MKKILLVSLVVVLALGAMGVAAALWWGQLYIDGLVTTGTVGAQWSIGAVGDSEPEGKDVSHVRAYFPFEGDYSVMWIDIVNAYPSIYYWVEWDIECTGSVPIHFATPRIETNLPEGTDFWFVDEMGYPIDWSQVQLHYGDRMWGWLEVHLNNNALQGTSYYFRIYLDYGQYNEFPPT